MCPVCANPAAQGIPALAGDGSDGAYVAWPDRRPEGELYAMHLTGEGRPAPGWPTSGALLCAWPPTVQGYGNGVNELDLAYVGGGRSIVAWSDTRQIPTVPEIDEKRRVPEAIVDERLDRNHRCHRAPQTCARQVII